MAAGILRRMMVLFPQMEPVDSRGAVDAWATGIADLSADEIRRGLRALDSQRYPPGLGEFRILCRPALDAERAWHEAVDGMAARQRGETGSWSHPAVWRAACEMAHELRTMSFSQCRRRWEMVLGRELDRGHGDGVPPPPPQIQDRRGLVAAPPGIRKQLAQLTKQLKTHRRII